MFESSFVPLARGQWDAAIARIEEALALNRAFGPPSVPSDVPGPHRVDPSVARRLRTCALGRARGGGARAAETDHPWWTSFAGAMLGWTLTEIGELDEAIVQLERGLAAADRDGAESYVVRCLSHLALATWLRGDTTRSEDLLDRAEEMLGERPGRGRSGVPARRPRIRGGGPRHARARAARARRAPAGAGAGDGGAGRMAGGRGRDRDADGPGAPRGGRPRGGDGACWSGRWTGRGTPTCPAWRGRRTPCWRTRRAAAGSDDAAAEHRAAARAIARSIAAHDRGRGDARGVRRGGAAAAQSTSAMRAAARAAPPVSTSR